MFLKLIPKESRIKQTRSILKSRAIINSQDSSFSLLMAYFDISDRGGSHQNT